MSKCDVCGRESTLFVTRSDQVFCAQCIEDLYWELYKPRVALSDSSW